MVFHIDSGRILQHEYTDEGFLNVYARIAKVGELKYFNSDGSERIEVVSPEVLFDKKSINSFKAKPVTLLHPPVKVTAKNSRKYQRGLTSPHVVIDGDFLGIVMTVTDSETIETITSGKAVEVSCGYDCESKLREDGKFDQLSRIGNHVAIVPRGRAGSEVRLQLDSETEVWQSEDMSEGEIDKSLVKDSFDKIKVNSNNDKTFMRKFVLDGIEFETEDIDLVKTVKGINKELEALRADSQKSKLTLDTEQADNVILKTKNSTLQGQVDGLTEEVSSLKATIEELKAEPKVEVESQSKMDAAEISSEVESRLETWSQVTSYLQTADKDFKVDSKLSANDIRKLALSKRFPNRNFDDKDSNYISGCFESVEWDSKSDTKADSVKDTSAKVDSLLVAVVENRKDSEDASKIPDYVSEYRSSLENAWKN